MELRQLEYFVAVAEAANFTRAAERVHISQSGVSAQIRQLERELGATLIDRSGRAASLTTAGEVALGHAREALSAAGALRRAVDEVSGVVRGHLTLGMVSGCTMTPLFDALAAFRNAHPGVELTLIEDDSSRLIRRVREGEIAAALVGSAGLPPGLEALSIVSEGLIAVVAPEHPLAASAHTTLAAAAEYPLICMPVGTGVRAVFDQSCAEAGVQPDVALQASAPAAVADLARRGLGVAILTESMLAPQGPGLSGVRIADVSIPAVLALVWKSGANPALVRLVEYCRDAFGFGG